MVSGPHVPGAELSAAFYVEVVVRLLQVPHSAGLLGWGSDVLGYDSARSTDHGWGPRVVVFLREPDEAAAVEASLDAHLPERFRGWPVRFGWDDVAVRHHVTVTTLPTWLHGQLGVDATADLRTRDWLLTPQQRLLGVVAGAVHADDSGELRAVRRRLRWYPPDVERWVLACQWHRIAQQEAFVARTAEVGDDLGSAVTAARLVEESMRLALLLGRRYAPYGKWTGTAFSRLPHPDELPRHLGAVLAAPDAPRREQALAAAYCALARRHDARGLTAPVDPTIRDYHGRPAQVLLADRFTDALLRTVTDPELLDLPLVGAVDQATDSTDVLERPDVYRRLEGVYAPGRT